MSCETPEGSVSDTDTGKLDLTPTLTVENSSPSSTTYTEQVEETDISVPRTIQDDQASATVS